jgi:hypothetical protein
MPILATVRAALLSALTFGASLASAWLVASPEGVPPIVPALIASLVLAGAEWVSGVTSPHVDVNPSAQTIIRWLVTFLAALGLAAVLATALPRGAHFTCEPLVPWRISIVMFGSFFSAWMAASMTLRTPDSPRYWLIPIVLSWIAPFYGFFHAPWFLAQSLAMPCPDRPLVQCVLAAGAMVIAALAGSHIAAWMFAGQRD